MEAESLTDGQRETLACFGGAGEPLTTTEVAERLDVGRRSAYGRLDRLVDRGRIETKKVGASARVWWRPRQDAGSPVRTSTATDSAVDDDHVPALADAFERISDGFFALDEDLRFTVVNDRAEELLGAPDRDLLGARSRAVFGPDAVAIDVFEDALETQEPTTFEEFDGSADTWLQHDVYPSESGLSVYSRDVGEMKEHGRRLERYEAALETIRDGVYVLDDRSRFVMVNGAHAELTGYGREELLGMHASAVTTDDHLDLAEDRFEELVESEADAATVTTELVTDDGRLPIETRFAPFDLDEDRTGRVGVVRDISERKRSEETLTALYDSARDLLDAGTAAEVGTVVTETAADVLGLSAVITYLHDEDGARLSPVAQSIDDELGGEQAPILPADESSIAGRVYATGDPRQFDDLSGSPRVWTEPSGIQSGIFVPMGDHGVLVVGSRSAGGFDERTRQLVELLAANAEVALDRVERQRALEESERRYRALAENFPNGGVALFDEELRYLTVGGETFGGLELSPDELEGGTVCELLPEELVEALAPRYRDVLDGETREFEVEFDGQVRVYRVLPITDADGTVFAGMAFAQDVTDRVDRERTLERQRKRLAALDDLNAVFRDITEAVIEQSTREEIEEIVCERLAETGSYAFAWIGEVDAGTRTVELRTEAGVEGYLDDVTISVDPEDDRSDGPTGRAIIERETQITHDARAEASHEPWRDHVREHGFRSSAAIPIVHDDSLYGVLNVYAERADAFTDDEREMIDQLGEVVGHTIAAVERKRALMSDEVVELEFRIHDMFGASGANEPFEGRISMEHAVPIGDGDFLVYGTADETALDGIETLTERLPAWEAVAVRDASGDARIEVRLSDPPVLSTLASVGGSSKHFVVEDGECHMTLHVAPGRDVRRIIETVRDAFPGADLLRRRQVTRETRDPDRIRRDPTADLTSRQRASLEAAYRSGFFEWPRVSSGEDVATSLSVAPSTFHQHLRKAQAGVFGELFARPAEPALEGER